jgi:hypothetical protein
MTQSKLALNPAIGAIVMSVGKSLAIALGMVLLVTVRPVNVDAAIDPFDWIGEYDMVHDGWVGVLSIEDTPRDCGGPRWCSMIVRYWNAEGVQLPGRIATMDQDFVHMVFHINEQRFDGYLFTQTGDDIAGTLVDGDRAYGFYAIRR